MRLLGAYCAAAFYFVTLSSHAVVIDLSSIPMTIGSNSLSFDINGISASVSGYHVEYDSTGSSTTIYGPFTTATATSSASFVFPNFGRVTSTSDGSPLAGLSLLAREDLGQTDQDDPAGGSQPGFDNFPARGSLSSFQFALFSFDAPVVVSQVILDSVSNYRNHVWVAGGNVAPDLNQDFLSAFSSYNFINSLDVPNIGGNGPIHTFTPLNGITYLAIGAPPNSSSVGNLGPVNATENSQFYIDGLNVSAVPVPGAVWLFGSGLLGLIGIARRKKTA